MNDETDTLTSDEDRAFRLSDYPMYFFAAIQAQNLRNASRALAPLGISAPEWRILSLVSESPAIALTDLASLAVLERSSASRAVSRLVAVGLLERQEARKDRRRGDVQLTDAGRDCLRRAQEVMRELYAKNFAGVSEEDYAALMRCLRTIRDNTHRIEAYWPSPE